MTRDLTDDEVRAEFLRRTQTVDHHYSKTPEECCGESPTLHLGYGNIPWALPSVDEMRKMLKSDE